MEVLFISYKYPPSIGGMQMQSYHLITGYNSIDTSHSIIYDQKGSLLFFFLSLFWKLPTLLYKNPNIQLIHLNDGVCGLCCIWLKLFTNRKVVVTYHGLDLVFPNFIYQKILLPLVRHADAVIAVSTYTAEQCVARRFSKGKIYVVKNGVDHIVNQQDIESVSNHIIAQAAIAKTKAKKQIVAIGRPVRRKGFVWFVKNVLPQLPDDIQFTLIGPYPDYNKVISAFLKRIPQSWQKQIELLLGLSTEHTELMQLLESDISKEKFVWHRNLNHTDKNYLLSQADLFVMPNVSVAGDMEGFGLVALEANMYDVPVLASGIEGITSAVVEGKNGWLMQSEDANGWIEAISHYLSEKPLIKCKEFATQNYSWDRMVSDYADVFSAIGVVDQDRKVVQAMS